MMMTQDQDIVLPVFHAMRYINLRCVTYPIRSSATPLLTLPTMHNNFGRLAFSYSAPDMWNNLPPDVIHRNTMNTFKKHLKTHLFTSSLTSPD